MLGDNEVAFVTGAGRGIGRQVAIALAEAGAAVALVARSKDQLDDAAEEIARAGGRSVVAIADVTDRSALENALRASEAALGPITLAVNNAGSDRPFGPVDYVDPDAWWNAQAMHVFGPYVVMHALIPQMRERGRGRIINVSSLAANIVAPNSSAYCVAKSTLVRLTEHVDMEIRGAGLAAFSVDPGTVMTDLGKAALDDPEVKRWAPGLVAHLEQFRNSSPAPALSHLGRQFVALASGKYDALSGRLIDLEADLDALLDTLKRSA